MAIVETDRIRELSPGSVEWIKAYGINVRNILDEIYVVPLLDPSKRKSFQELCQVYRELGTLYDGSLISSQDRAEKYGIRWILGFLRGKRRKNLHDSARKSLLRTLGRFSLGDVSKRTLATRMIVSSLVPKTKVDTYGIGPLSVTIAQAPAYINPIYRVSFVDHRTARLVFELARVLQLRSRLERKYLSSFRDLINWRKNCATHDIAILCRDKLPRDMKWAICSHAAYSSVGLRKYYPLLFDDKVNEFYLDAPGNKVYLDHERWNRCVTNIRLGQKDVGHFITHLKRENNQRLDYSVPSMKTDLSCADFNVRSSIDAFPLTRDGTAMDVRKFRRVPMTIIDLIANGTLNIESVAFLLFCFVFRRSISVVGEPSSGKTTLVNAIDICAPRWWRKITIEDVVESVSQLQHGRHQVRIQVEPLEQGTATRLKSVETTRLLHRNPTYVLLGEVQTAEHSKALFQALASGLRVIHTVHASSSEALIRRFLIQHGVSNEALKSLELMVFIKNFLGFHGMWRKVTRISELVLQDKSQPVVADIFRYDFEADALTPLFDVSRSVIVRKIMKEYPLGIEEIKQILNSYSCFLMELTSAREETSFDSIVKEFDSFNARIMKMFRLFESTSAHPQELAVEDSRGMF